MKSIFFAFFRPHVCIEHITANSIWFVFLCMTALFTYGRVAWPRQQPSLRPARRRWPPTCRWCHKSWSGSWGATPGDPERLRAGRVCTELPWQRDRNGQLSSLISDRKTTAQKLGASEAGGRDSGMLCDSLVLEICRKSKSHLASHQPKSQGLWLKAASLNYSNFISYVRC